MTFLDDFLGKFNGSFRGVELVEAGMEVKLRTDQMVAGHGHRMVARLLQDLRKGIVLLRGELENGMVAAVLPGIEAGKQGSMGGNGPGGRSKTMTVEDPWPKPGGAIPAWCPAHGRKPNRAWPAPCP